MADFLTAYKAYIQPIEGGYVNNPSDKGGETYAGIARNYHSTWSGWSYIDNIKKTRAIKRNEKFPALDDPTTSFYKGMWDAIKFSQINNQDVANILFDWYVNSGSNAFNTKAVETFGVQEILNKWFGKNIATDGAIGPQTIAAINSVDASKLYTIIKEQRKVFFDYLVKKDSSQATFYNGWLNRLKAFPDVISSHLAVTGLIGALLLAGAIWYFSSEKPVKRIEVKEA
jgi:lysozyme family protein